LLGNLCGELADKILQVVDSLVSLSASTPAKAHRRCWGGLGRSAEPSLQLNDFVALDLQISLQSGHKIGGRGIDPIVSPSDWHTPLRGYAQD
jgi:hypothetical protein